MSNTTKLVGKKILWVEDDTFLMDVVNQKISKTGAILLQARDGEEALNVAKKEKPDIIIMDVLLPGTDGIESLTLLKKSPETKDIPVIMFSNINDEAKIEQSMKLGAKSFIVKADMTMDDIVNRISEIF